MLKRLYHWILKWADSRWGGTALFILAFAESSFFPIPPDVLLIALCLGCTTKAFRYAFICTLDPGDGWLAMRSATTYGSPLVANLQLLPTSSSGLSPDLPTKSTNTSAPFTTNTTFGVVFTAGFTPIPYKLIVTITAGVFKLNIPMFIIASIVSRGLRFFLFGWLIWKYGAPIKVFIDKYFNWLAIAFTVLLIGSFVAVKYIIQ